MLLERRETPAATRVMLLEVMALAQLDPWPVRWVVAHAEGTGGPG